MSAETRAASAALGETMNAGFARMEARVDAGFASIDRSFDLQQAQHLELRGDFAEMRVDRLEHSQPD
jgi:hypothetical protein